MVHQHFTLADNLTVLENIVLGTRPLWQPRLRPRRGARAHRATSPRRFGLEVDPDARVGDLAGRASASGSRSSRRSTATRAS